MRESLEAVVADTVTLSNFARSGYLDILLKIFPDGVSTTSEVVDELKKGCTKYPELEQLLKVVGTWLKEVSEFSADVLQEQVRLKQAHSKIRRGADAGLIALAKVERLALLSDDRRAREIAQSEGVNTYCSAGLLQYACERGIITHSEMNAIAQAIAEKARYNRILEELTKGC